MTRAPASGASTSQAGGAPSRSVRTNLHRVARQLGACCLKTQDLEGAGRVNTCAAAAAVQQTSGGPPKPAVARQVRAGALESCCPQQWDAVWLKRRLASSAAEGLCVCRSYHTQHCQDAHSFATRAHLLTAAVWSLGNLTVRCAACASAGRRPRPPRGPGPGPSPPPGRLPRRCGPPARAGVPAARRCTAALGARDSSRSIKAAPEACHM